MKEHYEMITELREEDGTYQFCSPHMGGGMNMYMDGFHFTLSQSSDAPCLNLFLPQWTLHSRLRFFTAMLGVLALGITIEGVTALRSRYRAMAKITESERREISDRVQLLMTLLHGLQACIGYILMLATMTYSIELFLCTILGLCIGNFIFRKHRTIMLSNSSNPCCDFLEDELALNEPLVYGLESNEPFGCDNIKDEREEVESANDTFGSSVLEKRRKKHVIL